MKRALFLFALALFAASSLAVAAENAVDYDTEVQESEADTRQEAKSKTPSKSAERIRRFGGDVAVQKGLVRMETVRSSGAVLFYVVNGKKIFPAVDVNGYGRSNYLSLFIGAREYRLGKSANCLYHYDVDDNSITETFTVKKVAELTSTYTICKMDEKDEQENCVLVKHSFKNATGKKKVFVLKAVYNLCLGENRGFHYSTALKSDIGGEYVVLPSKDESWIISSDSQNAVEFIVHGKDVTPPKKAVMANKDVVELSSPSTSFNPGNSFESLLSYNNSSLGLYWDAVELDDGASAEYSYKINFSTNDFQNSGKLYPVEKQEEAKAEKAEEPKKEPASTDSSGYIDPSKLNEEYVQQLINHINSLEQSDPSLNRLKIQQLQTEVDEVLQVLRSRK